MPSSTKTKICFYATDEVYDWWRGLPQGDGGRLLNALITDHYLTASGKGSVASELQMIEAATRRIKRMIGTPTSNNWPPPPPEEDVVFKMQTGPVDKDRFKK